MNKFLKALALLLLVAMVATIPAMAEAVAVESLLGTDIEAAGEQLGLEKTQEQDADDAYLTLYENDGIMLGGREGKVIDITIFNEDYSLYGVTHNMTKEEVVAALDANGISYTEDELVELGIPTIEFTAPGSENATVSYELADGKVSDISVFTPNDDADVEEDVAEDDSEEVAETASKNYVHAGAKLYAECSVPVRKAPDRSAKKLAVIPGGSYAIYKGASRYDSRGVEWLKVSYNGVTGWASSMNTHFR